MDKHIGLTKSENFYTSLASSPDEYQSLITDGFLKHTKRLHSRFTAILEKELSSSNYFVYPYRDCARPFMRGITRSPFVVSNNFRDLLLNECYHALSNYFFNGIYQLHLARAVMSSADMHPFSMQVHRDIPYMQAPSLFPLSLSILTFLSICIEPQIRIWPNSHRDRFFTYDSNDYIDLSFEPGDSLIFDSNLVHCSLQTNSETHYVLHMFSTPLLKPVVDYSSSRFFIDFTKNPYRVPEILPFLGTSHQTPCDDYTYLDTH